MSMPADMVIETRFKPGSRDRDFEVMRWTDPETGRRCELSYYGKDSLTEYYSKRTNKARRKETAKRLVESETRRQRREAVTRSLLKTYRMQVIREFLEFLHNGRAA